MGRDIDFKKLCAQVSGHRDLIDSFQNPKRKKSGTSSSADTSTGPTPSDVNPSAGARSSPLNTDITPPVSAATGPTFYEGDEASSCVFS